MHGGYFPFSIDGNQVYAPYNGIKVNDSDSALLAIRHIFRFSDSHFKSLAQVPTVFCRLIEAQGTVSYNRNPSSPELTRNRR